MGERSRGLIDYGKDLTPGMESVRLNSNASSWESSKPMARLGQTLIPEKNYWRNPSNYVALATLLAVLTYTGFQIWQTYLIRSNNIVSQRAFLFVDSPSASVTIDAKDQTTKLVVGKYPPAKPGALECEPLEAVGGVADAAP
jgi:hypothetical protein